jgi:hypothetical protein
MKRRGLLRTALALCTPLATVALLGGCQSVEQKATYELRVTEAVVEADIPDDGPGTEEIAVRITWSADADGLVGSFSNPADTTATIHWDEATISFDGGEPVPILSAAPHPNPDLPQPPTVIPRYGQAIVGMLPGDAAEWEWMANRAMGGSWHPTSSLFGLVFDPDQSTSERRELAETAIGRKMMIELPIHTGSRRLTHIYDLRVTGVEMRPAAR